VVGEKARQVIEFLPPVPNPSRGPTTLRVNVVAAGRVRLEIVDVAGRQVRLLTDAVVPAGRYDFSWDGRDASDRPVPASIYFARFETATQSQVRRFVMLY
jgi:flagellar hook assembly protein FlgD